MLPDLASDPFGERSGVTTKRMQLLGAKFRFDSNSAELMRLVDCAYAGLPRHRLSGGLQQELQVSLVLTTDAHRHARTEPPPLAMISGSGLLGGAMKMGNFVVMSPRERTALVVVSQKMLGFPYHARYEMIEFAVFTLAARTQRLVSLHAACIGHKGRGILLIGPSGSGKSTLALHCLLDGLEFLSEDSAFICPKTMLATGVSNFAHIRANSLRWLSSSAEAAAIRKSPVIRRRSGVKKFELDLRRKGFRLAKSPLKIVGAVFLLPQIAGKRPLLAPISTSALLANLADTQGYAASQPQWREFRRKAASLESFELRRGGHPQEAVEALRSLLTAQ